MRYLLPGFLLLAVTLCLAQTTSTQQPSGTGKTTKSKQPVVHAPRRSPTVPFDFQLGITTLEEAEAKWREQEAVISSRTFAAVGAGSYTDGISSVYDPHVRLIDVALPDFEGLSSRNVRFVFFDGTLCCLQVSLHPMFHSLTHPDEQPLSKRQVSQLRKSLIAKYGQPEVLKQDFFTTFNIWKFAGNHLVLKDSFSTMLTFSNKALAEKVLESKKSICKEHPDVCKS